MPREILIAWAGRHQRSAWEDLCADYRQRIERMATVRDLPVRVRLAADDPQRQRAEGQALLAALPASSFVVALDARGEAKSSEAFAADLDRRRREWPHAVAFLIGSDLGLDETVLESARQVMAFGPLTLSHELARLVLYEQLFRALSIAAGMSYHRGPSRG
ncbi:MAG TPA: 23S rRNA (pseudouridine(1915)-N(3))-methyltransferase RlmH [Thermoanaerobaculia bacterium]|nr:23S rRNA (pseudouridine(1915)-N(3))-methyltransferase RlmH [Thermoanaerobaculia bacterium]